MITPKTDFQKGPHAKGWMTLMDSKQFTAAVAAALQTMDMQNRAPQDMQTAASYAYRKSGALQFLSIFMGLTEPEPTIKSPGKANLQHDV